MNLTPQQTKQLQSIYSSKALPLTFEAWLADLHETAVENLGEGIAKDYWTEMLQLAKGWR